MVEPHSIPSASAKLAYPYKCLRVAAQPTADHTRGGSGDICQEDLQLKARPGRAEEELDILRRRVAHSNLRKERILQDLYPHEPGLM